MPALLPFGGVLRGPRALGVRVARGARAGKDVSARADSGRCCFPSFSARHCAGTLSLLRSAVCRLDGYPAAFAGIAVAPLCTTIRLWLETLETIPRASTPPVPQLQLVAIES